MPQNINSARIKVAFASGPDDLNRELIDRLAALYPELPLYVVAEFAPHRGEWIPYHVKRGFRENLEACRAAFAGKSIRLAAVLLVPRMPYRRMRLIALVLSMRGFLAYNENLDSFMLRPRSVPNIARHIAWRCTNFARWQLRPKGPVGRWIRRIAHPREAFVPIAARAAQAAALLAPRRLRRARAITGPALKPGITVVIPSRNGKTLLEAMLPPLMREAPDAVVVVDNGSDDGTAAWLRGAWPAVAVVESSAPLSFAEAINRGLERVATKRVLLLNNDMFVAPGFLAALSRAFENVPDLFCSSAQIFFPAGVRREETGKPVMRSFQPGDFPIRCEEPIPGENNTWVLYGSGGCSLYDTAKLRALGGVSVIYKPAYVEDLDLGYRAWLRGWPSVFVSDAQVEHRHRATTSRYYSEAELSAMVEINYLRFVASAASSRAVFLRLWNQAVRRLHLLGMERPLRVAPLLALQARSQETGRDEEEFLALTNGDVAVFPGRAAQGEQRVVIVSPYLPFPLSHGGAVRMFNLMSRAAAYASQVLVSFCDELATPPEELLAICAEIVLVRRTGSHYRTSTERPDTVEEFDSPSFHAAVSETVRKWQPSLAQLEFTQMAQYAGDCAPAKTLLVEHDITFDLQQQLYDRAPTWELQRQLARWRAFETAAWKQVDAVVTMSEKDRETVRSSNAVVLPNGVDTARFSPAADAPESRRILFIGSFAHLPNLLAVEFFLKEVWPLLDDVEPQLHVIAGARHEYFLEFYQKTIAAPRLELEGFVADVRPAYRRAAVVIAPLTASAGTNIKILEAMAMAKAIVSTPAGINGLDLENGRDLIVAGSAGAFAEAVRRLMGDTEARDSLGAAARQTVLARYEWDQIAAGQRKIYEAMGGIS